MSGLGHWWQEHPVDCYEPSAAQEERALREEAEAKEEGASANQDGQLLASNPYEGRYARAWAEGWNEFQQVREQWVELCDGGF